MHRTLRFFITSIFLCAAFSAEAQERTDWALKAVEYERAAFNAEDPREAAEALSEKAYCYRQCGRYDEAMSTLGRISMYQLAPERVDDVLYEKELCSYLSGDFEGAASYMDEAAASSTPRRLLLDALVLAGCAKWDESQAKAVPPLGHSYTGHLPEGLACMGLDAAAVGWIVWQCLGGNWITGILGGGIALNASFMGGLERSVSLVDEYNRDALAGFNALLRDILLSHDTAE